MQADKNCYNLIAKREEELKTDEEISVRADEIAEELKKNCRNLREGTADERNAKRRAIARDFIDRIKETNNKKINMTGFADKHGIDRETATKYYNKIINMIRYHIEIHQHSFDEKERGRPKNPFSKISKEALDGIFEALEKKPIDYGMKYTCWTGLALQEFLREKYKIEISLGYLYNFLNRHRIVSLAASRRNPKANPEEVAKFKAGLLDKLKEAIRNKEVIVFLDETHVQQGSKHRGFAKTGKKPTYSTSGDTLHCHQSLLTVIGFDFIQILRIKGTVTSAVYIEALRMIRMAHPTTKFLIFRDNARIHTSKTVTEYLKSTGARKYIRFEALPRYCPELNPVEYFNNEYKGSIRRTFCQNEEDVSDATRKFILQFQNEKGISSKQGRRKGRQYFKAALTRFIYDTFIRALTEIAQERRYERIRTKKLA